MVCSYVPRLLTIFLLILSANGEARSQETPRSLTDLSGPWQLVVDDYLVSQKSNVTRRYHPLQKYAGNPIMTVDKPWERDIVKCAAVLPMEDGSGYRMWYSCWTPENDPDKGHNLYATSKDGLKWDKPNMGLVKWKVNGSTENNIIQGTATIMHTPWEKDPQLKYHGMGGGYYATASADGLTWQKLADEPSVKGGDVGRFMWDPWRKEYLAYVKVNSEVRGLRRRSIGFSQTTDLTHFPPLKLIMSPDDVDDRWAIPGSVQRTHFYGCNFFAYESMYLGLLWIFRGDELEEGYFHGPMFVELISSRDGVHWLREEGDRPPLLALGKPPRSWDQGMLCTVPPIVVGKELRVYYTGYDGPHDWLPFHAGIGLATLRKDGFVSLDAGEYTGEFTTKRFKRVAGELHVNTQASHGFVRVELLDENGHAIPGYGKDDCDPLQGNEIDQVVHWHGRSTLPERSAPTRLRFVMQQASLYSFRTVDTTEVIDDLAPPSLQVLYTFERGPGRALSDRLPADGVQLIHSMGTTRLDRDGSHAAFGEGSMTIGSPFRPLSRMQIEGVRQLGTHFTLAACVKSTDHKYARLFSAYRGNYPADTSELIFDFDPKGLSIDGLRLVCKGIPVHSQPVTFADDKYHHLGVVFDDGVVSFYLDGKAVGQANLPGGMPVTLGRDLLMGEDYELGTDEQFRGNIDDVLILGRALSPEEMSRLAREGAEKLLVGRP